MPNPIRNIADRTYRVFTYQSVDRVPDLEFGYWPQTIRRWLKEGLPLSLTLEETQDMFNAKVDAYFGFDSGQSYEIPLKIKMDPPFEEQILERRAESVIMRDVDGVIAERYQHDSALSSIPRFIEFPVKNPADWQAMKEHYRWDGAGRQLSPAEIDQARQAYASGKAIWVFFTGFYGLLRGWMGTEHLSFAFYDQAGMLHDMVEHWAELCVRQIEQLPAGLGIDAVSWWEDMAGKNGPLVSPSIFREFLQPGYRRVMAALKARGCVLGMVDCDGNPLRIVPNWLEEGVNIMFPLEVEAGVDPYQWRERFGMDLRLRGGIAKEPLVAGGKAIDRELERIKPLLEQGGYIPHLDHLVPPDISLANYCTYLEKKRQLICKV